MCGRQAKALSEVDIRRLLRAAARSKSPNRNAAIVLLSVRAGLRANEIAKLEWSMLLNSSDQVGDLITLPGAIVKYGLGRRIPVHRELKQALVTLWRQERLARGRVTAGPVVRSQRGH